MILATIKAKLLRAYQVVAANIGKVLAGLGGTILTVDAGQLAALRDQAGANVGPGLAHYLGIAIFGLTFLRFVYTKSVADKLKARIAELEAALQGKPPPPP